MFRKITPYLLNALWFAMLLIVIAIATQTAPFGKNTLLTIDLKQQYSDFFGAFRQTLLHQPDMLTYSFHKGIGGEMLGLWAYYLISPFNLLFLLVDVADFPMMITVVIALKLLCINSSFFFFARKKYGLRPLPATVFSCCYALSAYVVTYYSNVMWFDALLFLPLVALGLDALIRAKKWRLYVFALAATLITNYYIGFMLCIFLAMYAVYVWCEQKETSFFKAYRRFVGYSLLATLLASVVLVPTFATLLASKASYTQHTWNLDVAYTFEQIFSRSFIGSFNLVDIQRGAPLLYVGMITWLLAPLSWFAPTIKRREKGIAFVILTVFYLAFHYKVLNRLWHGGQFPIWYPYRFSFLWNFFVLILAMKAYRALPSISRKLIICLGAILVGVFYLYKFRLGDYHYLTPNKLLLSLALLALYSVLVMWRQKWLPILLLLLVSSELVINARIILPKFERVSTENIETQFEQLDAMAIPTEFQRVHKTFQRSRNDSLLWNYKGADHFSSTLEAHTAQFLGLLGIPNTKTAYNYTNGTLFTDDLLGIGTMIDSTNWHNKMTNDVDNAYYPIVAQDDSFIYRENANHFGLGVEVKPKIVDTELLPDQPIHNQETLLSLIDLSEHSQPYFQEVPLSEPLLHNVHQKKAQTYRRTDATLSAWMAYHFEAPANQPLYATIPPELAYKRLGLRVDWHPIVLYQLFKAPQIVGFGNGTGAPQTFKLLFNKQKQLTFPKPQLFAFDIARYEKLQPNTFNVTQFQHNHITGNITIEQANAYLLFSIPFDKNWKITVDGTPTTTSAVLNESLLAIPLKKGTHTITLTYTTPELWTGAWLSLFGLAICLYLSHQKTH
ncbi:MAG: YfhO family protein [Aerococcaceae bacterium]|nr:YfhO family protein [Aerococcaceae bacterium]